MLQFMGLQRVRHNLVTEPQQYRTYCYKIRAFLVAQTVKNPPTMQEIWVPCLGWEDPLEKGMAAHSSILAWRIPWREEPGGRQTMESQTVGLD